jgi:hypothetical protein
LLRQRAVTWQSADPVDAQAIGNEIANADAVIGAVLVPGAAAPRLITRSMPRLMKPGAVLVDVSIDQGRGSETSCPTTHDNPTYEVEKRRGLDHSDACFGLRTGTMMLEAFESNSMPKWNIVSSKQYF